VRKKWFLTAAVVLFFLSSVVAGAMLMPVVEANPVIPRGSVAVPIPPSIEVQSPLEGQRLNSAGDVWLKFTVTVPKTSWGHVGTSFGGVTSVKFILDSEQEQDLIINKASYDVISYSLNLGQLSDGAHTLKIFAEGLAYYGTSEHDFYAGSTPSINEAMPRKSLNCTVQVSFSVAGSSNATGVPPSVHVLSPENRTYEDADVSLNFTVDGAASQAWYVLDSGESIPIVENITLTELPVGLHSLTVYAINKAGNWFTPQTVNFEIVSTPSPPPQTFTTTSAIVASATMVAVIGACLFYLKKHQHQKRIL
jgi:hypothetical protein